MLEQETASIIQFITEKSGDPSPYYWSVPEHFEVPAVYYPVPEVETDGETFLTYGLDYVMYVKFFHTTREKAYALAYTAAMAIREARNLIPLMGEDGSEAAGSWVRVDDPKFKALDGEAAQLTVSWRSRKPYKDVAEGNATVQTFNFDVFMKSGRTISDEEAEALEPYAIPLQLSGEKPG